MKMVRRLLPCLLILGSHFFPTESLTLDNRVMGGKAAEQRQFPYQVSLETFKDHVCSGAILSSRYVITAARCYGFDLWIARAGGLTHKDGIAHRIKEKLPHPSYHEETHGRDIMLVQLQDTVHFTSNILPIPLQTEFVHGGVVGTASAFGNHSALEYLELVTVHNVHCGSVIEIVPWSQLCVKLEEGEGMSKRQDYGGPLVVGGKLTGLYSYHIHPEQGQRDVFTRVSSYVDWISETIQS